MTAFQKPSGLSRRAFSFVLLSCHRKQFSPHALRIAEDTHPSPLFGISGEETSVTPRNRCRFRFFRKVSRACPRAPVRSQSVSGCEGSSTVPLEIQCRCTLCSIEAQLLSGFARLDSPVNELFAAFPALLEHSTVTSLLSHLRASPADAANDNLFREIFALREMNPVFAESLLVLVFLPMLHRAVRLITRQQESLAEEDIAQQVLFFFLEFLASSEMATRRSHFAYAIAREVKRHIFEWAKRESRKAALLDHADAEANVFIELEDHFERFALLRHFLHRCVTKGMLVDSELDLLIQFKLDGNTGEELAALNGSSSNAVRQRFKRLLAKLRRLAR